MLFRHSLFLYPFCFLTQTAIILILSLNLSLPPSIFFISHHLSPPLSLSMKHTPTHTYKDDCLCALSGSRGFFFLPWWPHPGKSSTFWLKIVPVIKSIHYLLPLGITLVCKAGSRLIWGKTFVSLIALLGQMCGRGNETLTCHRRNEAWCE